MRAMELPARAELESIAVDAGNLALRHFRHVASERKADRTLVTAADREVEAFLVAALRSRLPEAGILGEEGTVHDGRGSYRIVLDPIDGTAAFVAGLPTWCIGTVLQAVGGCFVYLDTGAPVDFAPLADGRRAPGYVVAGRADTLPRLLPELDARASRPPGPFAILARRGAPGAVGARDRRRKAGGAGDGARARRVRHERRRALPHVGGGGGRHRPRARGARRARVCARRRPRADERRRAPRRRRRAPLRRSHGAREQRVELPARAVRAADGSRLGREPRHQPEGAVP